MAVRHGTSADDTLVGGLENDTLYGRSGDDSLLGGEGDDYLAGERGADTLLGGGGNDYLTGGLDPDLMRGGAGNDTYGVHSLDDIIDESDGSGIDRVEAVMDSYTLGAGIEQLGRGGASRSGQLAGNELDNLIEGLGGLDELVGHDGDDSLNGGDGDDTLIGGNGSDTLRGGLGNDRYLVDATDVIGEPENGGIDTVRTALSDYRLLGDFENLRFTSHADHTGIGNSADNLMIAAAGADSLLGNGGDDTLDGRARNDTLDGFTGNDSLLGGTGDDALSGGYGDGADVLDGGNGNDTLVGGKGDDTLIGGAGSDVYDIDSHSDRIIEQAAGSGDTDRDLVRTTVSSFVLSDVQIEDLAFAGIGSFSGIGNRAGNRIAGGAGRDILDGASGNDTLDGGGGADNLIGGGGRDVFAFKQVSDIGRGVNTDRILDFTTVDMIDLSALDANTTADGDQSFTYIAGAAFSDNAGELRFDNGALSGDVNGDGNADFTIQLVGVTSFSADDLMP